MTYPDPIAEGYRYDYDHGEKHVFACEECDYHWETSNNFDYMALEEEIERESQNFHLENENLFGESLPGDTQGGH